MTTTILTAIFSVVLGIASAGTPSAIPSIGRRIENFTLTSVSGQKVSLDESKDAQAVVVLFVGAECPLVQQYLPRMHRIAEQFQKQGVSVLCIDSNVQDTPSEIQTLAKKVYADLTILMDPDAKIADAFGAHRTPEVFLLDQDRVIRYKGRIDDQFEIGVHRAKPTRTDLVLAIEEVLAKKPVSVAETKAIGCIIGRSSKESTQNPTVTYAEHVEPIFRKRCVECHREGEISPFSLTSYDNAKAWGETVAEIVDERRMPPWFASPKYGHFANETQMPDAERAVIRQWVNEGCPPGDLAKVPPLPEFSVGWALGEPDKVYDMGEDFHVPATGVIGYKHYTIDPGFTEDMWAISSEARPGARGAVHHILVFAIPPGGSVREELMEGRLIGAYAPGVPAHALEPGQAVFLPKGTKIVMQMHYTTNGIPQVDRSTLGLRFCKADQVKQRVESGMAINFLLMIPPNNGNRTIQASHVFLEDQQLLTLTPHMHVRGKAFRYEAVYPNGEKEIILDIPRYDFNWQITYRLAEPKLMPKGTKLLCTAVFDNSSANPNNPNPNIWVRFGPQTWDEMLIGWYTASLPSTTIPPQASAR